jgi:hypothetical protein
VLWFALLLLAASCGRVGFDRIDDAPIDTSCWARWRSGAPNLTAPQPALSVNTTSYEDNAFESPDGLTLYFRSNRSGTTQFWYATRADLDSDFTPVAALLSLTPDGTPGSIHVLDGGHIAYVSSTRAPSIGGFDLWLATRSDLGDTFTMSEMDLAALETTVNEYDQQPVHDGMRLYWASGAAATDIYVADRPAPNAPFGTATPVDGVNSSSSDDDPFVSPDELAIVFTSQRGATRDIYIATRTSTTMPFTTPAPVDINDPTLDDANSSLSADGCTLWFDRPVGGGQTDLFVSRVVP